MESFCSIINGAGRLPINKIKLSPVRLGVLLVLASVLQAGEVGWGTEVSGILPRCSEGPDGSSCCHGQTPGTRASPRPLSPRQQNEQPLLDPQARHRNVKRETPCAPRPGSVSASPPWWGFVSLDRARVGFRGGGGSWTCLGILRAKGLEEGPRGRAFRPQLQRYGGLAQLCLQAQVHPAGIPRDGHGEVLASMGHRVPGLLLPTQNWG